MFCMVQNIQTNVDVLWYTALRWKADVAENKTEISCDISCFIDNKKFPNPSSIISQEYYYNSLPFETKFDCRGLLCLVYNSQSIQFGSTR